MDGKNASLPKPKFETRVIEKDRLHCQICFVSCSKKHKGRSKLEKITDLASFKFYSEKWKSVDYKYNKVFGFVDWNSTDEKYVHKACKSTFLKESFLNSQKIIRMKTTLYPPTIVRKSTRQNLLYKFNQIE